MAIHRSMLIGFCFCMASVATAQPRWVAWFDGHGQQDNFRDVVVDGDGNLYATGAMLNELQSRVLITVKYAPDGSVLWTRTVDGGLGLFITLDGAGNPTVAAVFTNDAVVIRYDADGNELWRATEVKAAPNAVVVLPDGTTYVAGRSHDRKEAMWTWKISPAGEVLWGDYFTGGANRVRHAAYAMAVDDAGSAYVVGRTGVRNGDHDAFLLKYDTGGQLLWARNIAGHNKRSDEAGAVVLAADGSPVVLGQLSTSDDDGDLFAARFDPSGNQQWLKVYDDSTGLETWVVEAAIGEGDRIVVGGSAPIGEPKHDDMVTLSIDAEGNLLWFDRYGSPEALNENGRGIELDAHGNAYVTGFSHSVSSIGDDITTIKYSPTGDRMWVARFNGREDESEAPFGMALAQDGSALAVAGRGDYVHNSDLLPGDALAIVYPTFGNGCKESERLVTHCSVRPRGHKIRAKAMFGTRDEEVRICLDGGDCQSGLAIGKAAKVRLKWRRVEAGSHEVTAEWACGARRVEPVACGG